MKVGFSYGRCVRDLVKGTVNYDDVLLIYAATYISIREHISEVFDQYLGHRDYLAGLDRDTCIDMAHRIWDDGKLIQPRLNGKSARHIRESGVWMDLAPTVTDESQQSELVQKAWRDYQVALKLSSTETIPDDQFRKRTAKEEAELNEAYRLLSGSI